MRTLNHHYMLLSVLATLLAFSAHAQPYPNKPIKLIVGFGLESVELLEADQTPRKYTIDELKEIISTYRQKVRELKNGN